jgi:hypothetical protein
MLTAYFELNIPLYVLHILKDKRDVLLEIHNALLPTLQATIMLILQPCHNPHECSFHSTGKIHLGGVPSEVCILLLKL